MTTASRSTITIYSEGTDGGHYPRLLGGLAAACAPRFDSVTVVSRLTGLRVPAAVRLEPLTLGATWASRLKRMRQLVEAATRSGGLFVNMDLDMNYRERRLWSRSGRVAHVLHRPGIFGIDPERPRGTRAIKSLMFRALGGFRLEETVITFSARGLELAGATVPHARLGCLGYPIRSYDESCETTRRPSGGGGTGGSHATRALFVAPRPDKGFDVACEALTAVHDAPILVVTGAPSESWVDAKLCAYPDLRLECHVGHLSEDELRQHFESTDMVLLPYSPLFGKSGGQSAVLLDAMTYGCPVVASPSLADQIPSGYGAVISAGYDGASLAVAIAVAQGSFESLREQAADVGPHTIVTRHTYESFIDGLAKITSDDRCAA